MSSIPDDPERIARDTEAALDRRDEAMGLIARSRAARGLPLSETLVASASPIAIGLAQEPHNGS